MSDFFNMIEKNISKDVFSWILKDAIAIETLEKIADTCGVLFPANLPQSKQLNIVTNELASEFYKNSLGEFRYKKKKIKNKKSIVYY